MVVSLCCRQKCCRTLATIKRSWEAEPLAALASEQQLQAFQHDGFWHPMDTLRDKNHLEALWLSGEAPWKQWD